MKRIGRYLRGIVMTLLLAGLSPPRAASPTLVVCLSDDHGQPNLPPEFAHPTHVDKALARDGGGPRISWYVAGRTDAAAAAIVRRYHERPTLELDDLRADPFEQRNLARDPAHPARAPKLLARLEDWMREQADSRTLLHAPRLLTDPASIRPGTNSGTDDPHQDQPRAL